MSAEKNVFNYTTLNRIYPSEIQFQSFIGKGTFGSVHHAVWRGIEVAVKEIQINNKPLEKIEENFYREANVMAICQSPHIVKLYGVCGYSLIMEYMPKGSLYSILISPKEHLHYYGVRWRIAKAIGHGLSYLHHLNIVHGDLKSGNVVVDDQYNAKITDLGTANFDDKMMGARGTYNWRASETLEKGAIATKASDVYAYGMVLWEIAARRFPFLNIQDENLLCEKIRNGAKEKIPEDCPGTYTTLIQACWMAHTFRPTIDEILDMLERFEPKNYQEYLLQSVKHLELEAERRNYTAQSDLGLCYQHGIGKNQDPFLAVKYYQLSADQGWAYAQYHLAGCYENGTGVEEDLVFAVKYYRLAANQGHTVARSNLKQLFENHPELKYQGVMTFQSSFFSLSPNTSNMEIQNSSLPDKVVNVRPGYTP